MSFSFSTREAQKNRRAKDLKQKIQERLELDPEKQAMKLVVETWFSNYLK